MSGTGRYFIVDPHPVAVDNDVHLDASQLRGSFQFNVTGPDYDYIQKSGEKQLRANFPTSYTYNGFHIWGSEYDHMRIAFGQSNVVLSHVNPELSVQINSENMDFAYPDGTFPPNSGPQKQVVVSDYPVTVAQRRRRRAGQHSRQRVGAESGADSRRFRRQCRQQLDSYRNDADRLDDRGGPHATRADDVVAGKSAAHARRQCARIASASRTRPRRPAAQSLRTSGDNGPAAEVYVMGKTADRALEIVGNLHLTIGRRLHANGIVDECGPSGGSSRDRLATQQAIYYNFTGPWTGPAGVRCVQSCSGDEISVAQGQAVIIARYQRIRPEGSCCSTSRAMRSFTAANTDLDFFGPTIAAQPCNPTLRGSRCWSITACRARSVTLPARRCRPIS